MAEKPIDQELTLEQSKDQLLEIGKNVVYSFMKRLQINWGTLNWIPNKWMNFMRRLQNKVSI